MLAGGSRKSLLHSVKEGQVEAEVLRRAAVAQAPHLSPFSLTRSTGRNKMGA
jgi:hypothetical protein